MSRVILQDENRNVTGKKKKNFQKQVQHHKANSRKHSFKLQTQQQILTMQKWEKEEKKKR